MVYGSNYTKSTIEETAVFNYKELARMKAGGRRNKTVLFGAGGSVNFIDFGYIYNLSASGPFNEVYTGLHNIQVSFNFLANKPNKNKEAAPEN